MDKENASDTLKLFTARILLVIRTFKKTQNSYDLHLEMEKQEQLKKKLADKKERKAEKRKIKEEKKNQPAELHGSWASAKRQKEQTVIQKFEGKKITFDDSD